MSDEGLFRTYRCEACLKKFNSVEEFWEHLKSSEHQSKFGPPEPSLEQQILWELKSGINKIVAALLLNTWTITEPSCRVNVTELYNSFLKELEGGK